ncbi:MAG: recombinase family protein [Bacilli bacterium]|nr:recombinase family protein [Bacilli bacterium]
MIAGLYIRVSTDEQVKYGLSLDAQELALKTYCKEHKIKVYKVYKDEGVSAGTITKRKALLNLLDDLDKINLVLFTKLDRLSRNIKDAIELNDRFKTHNVNMIAVQDQYIDTSSANGEFIFNLRYALAQQERKQVAERINSVNEYKRQNKLVCSGAVPFGYKIEDKKLVPSDNAKKIIDLFNYYATIQNLNKTIIWYSNKYESIHYTTVKRYLRNPVYIGRYKLYKKEEYIDDYCEPIISKELYYKVQNLLDNNLREFTKKSKPIGNPIFNTLLICKCGNKFTHKHKGHTYYYHCRKRYLGCHKSLFLEENFIEKYLIDNLPLELEKLKIRSKNYLKKGVLNIEIQKKRLNDKISRLQKAYIDGNLDYEVYKSELIKTKDELSKLEEPKHNIEELDELLKSNALEIYKTFSKEEKRMFWKGIIKEIEVSDELTIKFY